MWAVDYLFVAAFGSIGVVFGGYSWRHIKFQLLGLDFDVATTWLVGGIVQWSDFRSYLSQVWWRSISNLDFVHWHCGVDWVSGYFVNIYKSAGCAWWCNFKYLSSVVQLAFRAVSTYEIGSCFFALHPLGFCEKMPDFAMHFYRAQQQLSPGISNKMHVYCKLVKILFIIITRN